MSCYTDLKKVIHTWGN